MAHRQYVQEWESAMRYGMMNGRPFSENSIKIYCLYANMFLNTYPEISFENLRQMFMSIPVENFAKRAKIYDTINCFGKFLVEQEILPSDFLERIKKIKPRRHFPPKKITVDEAGIEKLLTVCDGPLDRILLELLSQTGLRISEACQLTLGNIDLEKGYLTVKRAKWGKTRRVGLTLRAIQGIQEYLEKRPKCVSEQLLVTQKGKPIDRYGAKHRLVKLGNRIGIKVSPHALRRAFVTINANKGRPLPMLQIACGHSDITTTRSYCLTSEDETIEAMKKWS